MGVCVHELVFVTLGRGFCHHTLSLLDRTSMHETKMEPRR
jgi:hypothetical protein